MNRVLKDYLAKNDYKKVAADCVEWIRSWFLENGPESPAVIGISGGKDSSVVAALCVQALGRERVFGVLMPDGVQKDIEVARHLVQYLGIQSAEQYPCRCGSGEGLHCREHGCGLIQHPVSHEYSASHPHDDAVCRLSDNERQGLQQLQPF